MFVIAQLNPIERDMHWPDHEIPAFKRFHPKMIGSSWPPPPRPPGFMSPQPANSGCQEERLDYSAARSGPGILVLAHREPRQGDRLDSGRHGRVLARQTDMRRGGRVVEGARLESV